MRQTKNNPLKKLLPRKIPDLCVRLNFDDWNMISVILRLNQYLRYSAFKHTGNSLQSFLFFSSLLQIAELLTDSKYLIELMHTFISSWQSNRNPLTFMVFVSMEYRPCWSSLFHCREKCFTKSNVTKEKDQNERQRFGKINGKQYLFINTMHETRHRIHANKRTKTRFY